MSKVCVIIPIHSSTPSEVELISFKQCFRKLSDFDIFVVSTKNVDLTVYKKFNSNFILKVVPDQWLSSIENYNKMKIEIEFYQLFNHYEYLLTYELDAYVFENQLNGWVSKGYDYIGAPIVDVKNDKLILSFIGNSGFSLRNVHSCQSCLNRMQHLKILASFITKYRLKKVIKFIAYFENHFPNRFFTKFRIISSFLPGICIHEDIFWSRFVPKLFEDFKIPSLNEGLSFSFERFPELCYEKNNFKLPFGCHAWNRYNYSFWKKWIS
jgi:hypothetical protein